MSTTCMQQVIDKRTHRIVTRRRPHDVPDCTLDPDNGYAQCASCGAEVYVGTGLHPNLGVSMDSVDAEVEYLHGNRR